MTNRERESLTGSSARLGRWVMSMKDLRVLRRPPYDAARVPPSAGEPADRVPVWASVCPHRVLRLLRVELDDQLLLHRGVDHLPGRQRVHQHAHLGGDDLQPRGDRPAASLGPGYHERRQLPARRAHLDDVVLADPVRRDVDFLAVDHDVPVPHHLTGHVPGLGEAGPVDHVVQPRLEDAQQFVAGLALATVGLLVVATELLLQYAIDAGALLLLALLLEVLAVLGTAAAVLTRRVRADLDWALRRLALGALEEQLHLLAATALAVRSGVAGHGGVSYPGSVGLVTASSDAAALGGTAAVVRHRGDVLDGTHLQDGGLQRPDRGLPAGAGSLDEDVHLAHAVLLRLAGGVLPVSYTHLRAHETPEHLVCRLLLEKKKKKNNTKSNNDIYK